MDIPPNDTSSLSPGDVIHQYIIEGLNISVPELAHALNVPSNRLYLIIKNERDVSVDTAVRLGLFLDMDPHFWMALQSQYHIKHYLTNHPTIQSAVTPLKTLNQ
jgi:addiction module HigA family antidote